MSEYRVFVSYAAADTATVQPLTNVLREAGYSLVDASLFTGLPTRDQFYGMMLTCEAFISFMAPASLESELCQRGYEAAVEAGIPIVPIMPDDILTQDVGLLIHNAAFVPPEETAPLLPEADSAPLLPEPLVMTPAPSNRQVSWRMIALLRRLVPVAALVILAGVIGLAVGQQPRPEPPAATTVAVVAVVPEVTVVTETPTFTPTPSPTPTLTPTPLPGGAVPFAPGSAGVLVATFIKGLTEGLTDANIEFTRISQPVRSHDQARSLGIAYNAAVVVWSAPEDNQLYIEFLADREDVFDRVAPLRPRFFPAADAPYLLSFVEALIHLVQDDSSGALDLLNQAAVLIPQSEQVNHHADTVYFYRGIVYDRMGEYNDAILDYNRALDVNPELYDSYFNRGIALYQYGDFVGAQTDFTRVITLRPDDATAFYYRANVFLSTDKLEEALADYNKALALRPDYISALNNRGTIYGRQGDFDAAIADYNRAIELQPDFASAYANRGLVYRNLADYDRALADYDRAIQLDPTRPEAYYTRGIIYASLKEYDTAIVNFNRAAILAPDDERVFYMRGVTRTFQQDTAGAEADFKQAITLNPAFADPYAALGAIYHGQGKREAAIEAYRQHIALAGDKAIDFAVAGLQQLQQEATPEGQ